MNRQQRRAEKKQASSGAPVASPAIQNTLAEALRHHQAGRLNEAERLYRQNLALDPRHADSLHLLGMIAYQSGRHEVAAELIGQAIGVNARPAYYHSNLGLVLHAQGKLDEAVAAFRQALAREPDYIEAQNNLGNALKDQGKLDEAIACYRRVLVLKPGLAEAHNNLGNALSEQGHPQQAAASFRQALAIKPDYAEAHSNLGNALRDEGKSEDAIGCYRRALALRPDIAEAHNNLGNALRDLGQLDEAASCYRKALELKPHYASCLNNLALLLKLQGDVGAALSAVKCSLQIKETAEAKKIFVECVRNCRDAKGDSDIAALLVRALSESWCRPGRVAGAAIALIKQNPAVGACIARADAAWPRQLSRQELFGADGLAALAAEPLLLVLLCSTPVCDIATERFLTMARRLMLDDAREAHSAGLEFHAALARQCFINEYIFARDDDEIRKAEDLRGAVNAALETNAPVPLSWVLAVATYVPLLSLPSADRLLDQNWSAPIAAILTQQIGEPKEEQRLRATIPRLTGVNNDVSRLVQDQYEENPYPRWVMTEPAVTARGIVDYLSQHVSPDLLKGSPGKVEIDVLIAGCGTGQHSIGIAQLLKRARVLAVDLSLSSLSYAKRMTQELGLTSIEYAQADLLELASLDRQFDVIGSVGVLHHLADPFAGWRVLLSLLRPGGFMNLGFYSKVARHNVVEAQAFIAEHGYQASADDIRRCRQDLMRPESRAKFAPTLDSPDFYSMSECRDLLFHAQEHVMTLADIKAFLHENRLVFLGFETASDVRHAYKQRFPDDPAATDLDHWQAFENDNPSVFTGMYQFWIQKA
jgi:tetratricopeptide (TPR) repeat protein/2-polyprenyl-3-methyl-5-hydroxy-6-metoxy-1,4-benzoquinol methylase